MEVGGLRDRAGVGANVEQFMAGKLKGPDFLYAAPHHTFQFQ